MRRWDRLLDSYLEEYRAKGVSPQTIAYTEALLNRWGRWLKGRRPRVGIEEIDADMLTRYIGKRASFRSKAPVSATLSSMRGFGDYLVHQGLWKINPLRWMKGPKVTAPNGHRGATMFVWNQLSKDALGKKEFRAKFQL